MNDYEFSDDEAFRQRLNAESALDVRWVVVTEAEALGYAPGYSGMWAVIDAGEDDPPECLCHLKEAAERIAKALNLLEGRRDD